MNTEDAKLAFLWFLSYVSNFVRAAADDGRFLTGVDDHRSVEILDKID
jgi:hypothetical protein